MGYISSKSIEAQQRNEELVRWYEENYNTRDDTNGIYKIQI